jgi:hypothetical protein
MIISEISPTAQQIIGVTPFSSETITLTHMSVYCFNYVPGSDTNVFTSQFGVPKTIVANKLGLTILSFTNT